MATNHKLFSSLMNVRLTALLFLLTTCTSVFSQQTFPVHFEHGTEYFPENFATVRQSQHVDGKEIVNGVYVRFIQLESIMDAPTRAAFEAKGAKIIGYIQFGAYLVLLPQNFDLKSLDTFAPRSVIPVKSDWKIAKSLREQPYGDWAVRGNYLDINIQVYPHLRIAEGAMLCQKAELEVLQEGNQNGFLQLRVHKNRLDEIAAMPFVQYMELIPPPGQKEDTRGRSLHRANLVASDGPMGKKYDGAGVGVLVRDDGRLGPHIDIQGRLKNFATDPETSGTHGDGVVGIIGGAGNLDPTMKGMAAGTTVYSLDYVNNFQDQTMPLFFNENVTLTNSSYSDGCNAGYSLAAQTVDRQLFQNPTLMHIFSAGNSNDNNCGYGAGTQWGNITGGHKMAKNAIATANIFADATLVQSSSRGPAYDGRLKPDISANGQGQGSLDPNNAYQVFGGTSGAAPGIAGCLAQLTHAYRTIYNVPDAPSALLKATILNTANDLGNVGPDFRFGWGHINAWRALQLLEQNNWLENSTDQNGSNTHTLEIPADVKEAKIMLYWSEPPASVNNSRALINDLDLTVTDGSGTVNLPWVLNPTPVPALLNAPAGKGRDSLNNVEQVLLVNPAAGNYTIEVKGTEVPLGPQPYYLVWEFVKDEIKITYPAGGEGFVPGEVERIHWDAYGNTGTFTLRYSTDGGNTFVPITSLGGDRRMYDWTVPNTVTGKLHLMIFRGMVNDTTDFPASIVPVPQNLQVTKVCLDSITLGFDAVNDTLSYEGYLMGNKYMELKGSSSTNSITMPFQNTGGEQWLSVRSSHPDGTAGRRAVAIYWPGGILNCPQQFDLDVAEMLSPAGNAVIACSASEINISLRVNNGGLNASVGATANYQVNNEPPVSEPLPDIPAGSNLDYTFQTPLSLNTNGDISLKTWVVLPNDVVTFNDTLTLDFPVISATTNQLFVENFESEPKLPVGWAQVNPDVSEADGLGWELTDELSTSIVGPDDIIGRSLHLNFFDYGPDKEGQEDYLYMIPVDLSGLVDPTLTFYVAYAPFNATFFDGLRVEVFANCDLSATPDIIWEKSGADLATVPNQTGYFYADSGADWRIESADLSAYEGQNIVMRFVSVNGYGNSLYLDNIGISSIELPSAAFIAPDTICRLDTLTFEAIPSVSGSTYAWNFGSAANPGSANGIGPHAVLYPTAGNKTVRLIVTNAFGADTMIQIMNVRHIAVANFTFVQDGLNASFTNTSTNSTTYLWDFGDNTTSTEANPMHTYAAPGTYTVTLSATNACRTHQKTATLGVTGINELTEKVGVLILPNPTAGDFAVELNSNIDGPVQLSLFDAAGRILTTRETMVSQGISRVRFEQLNLPKGIYQLNIQADGKQASFNVVVQ